MRRLMLPLAALLVLSACSGSAEAEAERECLKVPMRKLKEIASNNDIKPIAGAAVKAEGFKGEVFMIAMEFEAFDFTDEGVWASTSIKPGGPIMSVDGMAQEFTKWPNGTVADPLDISSDGAKDALACLS